MDGAPQNLADLKKRRMKSEQQTSAEKPDNSMFWWNGF